VRNFRWRVVFTGAATVVAGAMLGASHAARAKIELTLPSWSEEDESAFAKPGSFLLGGGLLPGTGPAEDVEPEGDDVAPELAAEGGESGGGEAMSGADGEAPGVAVGAAGEMAAVEGAPVYGPAPEPETGPETPLPVRVRPEIPLLPERVEVPREYASAYFSALPGKALVDPQLLLTEFKKYDLEEFLEYHEQESPYRICIFLFEGNQELPNEASLQSLHEEWYGNEPVVMLAYFMGQPDRAVVEFGRMGRSGVSSASLERVRESCVEEGLVVENAFNQLERFGVELSVQLYWLEKELGLETPVRPRLEERRAEAALSMAMAMEEGAWWREVIISVEGLPRWVWVGGGSLLFIFLTGGLGLFLRRHLASRQGYLFPDYEIEPRLGGAHAGGGQEVLSFGRPQGEERV
jgi:hypothetical protein